MLCSGELQRDRWRAISGGAAWQRGPTPLPIRPPVAAGGGGGPWNLDELAQEWEHTNRASSAVAAACGVGRSSAAAAAVADGTASSGMVVDGLYSTKSVCTGLLASCDRDSRGARTGKARAVRQFVAIASRPLIRSLVREGRNALRH